ncbi:TRAP transporter substrate-binding protein, partial [Thermodesulfobacteriota bacterium]
LKGVFVVSVLVLVALSFMTAHAVRVEAAGPDKVWNLRFALDTPPQAPKSKGTFAWAKKVEQATNGKVKIKVYAGSTLCKLPDTMTAIQSGVADLGDSLTGVHRGAFPLTEVITLPFVGGSSAAVNGRIVWKLYEEFPAIQAEYKDFKLLGLFCTDAYRLLTIKKPVRKLEDIKGLKLRAAGGPPTHMTKAFGAVPVSIRMPGTYLALQKGTIDGMWWNYDSCVSFRQYEVSNYVTDIPTSAIVFWVMMNKDVWNGFPKNIQNQIMSVSGVKIAEHMGGSVWDSCKGILDKRLSKENVKWPKEWIKLSPAEEARWIKVGGKPIVDKWVEQFKDRGPTQQILDRTLELKKQYM